MKYPKGITAIKSVALQNVSLLPVIPNHIWEKEGNLIFYFLCYLMVPSTSQSQLNFSLFPKVLVLKKPKALKKWVTFIGIQYLVIRIHLLSWKVCFSSELSCSLSNLPTE